MTAGASSQRYSPDQPALSHFARRLNYILIYIRSVPRECGTHGKCMRERLQPLCFIIPPEFCTTTFSHCQLFHLRSNLKRTRQNDRRLLRLSCSNGAQFNAKSTDSFRPLCRSFFWGWFNFAGAAVVNWIVLNRGRRCRRRGKWVETLRHEVSTCSETSI